MAPMGSFIHIIGYIYVSIIVFKCHMKSIMVIFISYTMVIYIYIYINCFHKWGIMDGKSPNIMDDLRGYHHFRKPPYVYIYIYMYILYIIIIYYNILV